MRVNFEHSEKTETHGLIRKVRTTYYHVCCNITLSEEEQAIIRQRGLGKSVFFEHEYGADVQEELKRHPERKQYYTRDRATVTISRLTEDHKGKPKNGPVPIGRLCYTPVEAKNFEIELTEALKKLKAYIDDNKEIEQTSSTFEL